MPAKKKKRASEKIYSVDELRARKIKSDGTGQEFLVKWAGCDEKDCSWEPASNILDPSLIDTLDAAKDFRWEYESKSGWNPMNTSSAIKTEEAYKQFLKDQSVAGLNYDISSIRKRDGKELKFIYCADFNKLPVQTNLRSNRRRLLRRIPIIPVVAEPTIIDLTRQAHSIVPSGEDQSLSSSSISSSDASGWLVLSTQTDPSTNSVQITVSDHACTNFV